MIAEHYQYIDGTSNGGGTQQISISHVSVFQTKTKLKPITIVASIISSQGGKVRRLLELINELNRMCEIKSEIQLRN